MEKFKSVFKGTKPIIGMIHVKALPGTPKNILAPSEIITAALEEADVYRDAGIDAIMIENMHDVPYLKGTVGPEISSLMTLIGYLVKQRTKLPVGIQLLAGANMEALAAANSAGLDFIRAEGFVFAHVADEGIIESQAGELQRYRKKIAAQEIAVFTDIKKKHSSHAITQDVSLLDTAKAAHFFMSDGLIITGSHTGQPVSIAELKSLKNLELPIFIGSGITKDNVSEYFPLCDGMIIGSYFKKNGYWQNELDRERIGAFMKVIRKL
ncbi:BtpA/SgcQ family protein [Sediminicola sp. 1XM1-17]|uniref:BtpA/SgcQ family protein n=1 Tax=Sediminicola sp. 1XM1-17 TaxID=3127702 RepID=UPI0030783E61